jgi:hypothetical protein
MDVLLILVWLPAVITVSFAGRWNLSDFLLYLRLDHEADWIRLGRLRELGWSPLDFNVVLALAYRAATGKEQFSLRATRAARNSMLSALLLIFLVGILPSGLSVLGHFLGP